MRLNPAHVALVHDTAMAAAAFLAAVLLRWGTDAWEMADDALTLGTPVFTAVAAITFRATGLYRGVWRYASLEDVFAIVKAATVTVLVTLAILFLVMRGEALPRGSLVIAWGLLVVFLSVPRFLYRVVKDGHMANLLRRTQEAGRLPVLLIGSGDEAEVFIREMTRRTDAPYRPIGIVDWKDRRVGRSIRGIPVLGTVDEVPDILHRRRDGVLPQQLLLTQSAIAPQDWETLLALSEQVSLPLVRLPRLADLKGGETRIDPKPISIDDLLGRPQAELDREAMATLIGGRRVLVTGAGGTIGGELVRQIAAFGPARLTLVDHSEYALYLIDLELAERFADLNRAARLLDVRDRAHVDRVFAEERPDLVFHAAALKHVPMVEANPADGILTNASGSRNVADRARAHGVTAMVLISSDKAVNPTNVMGATKRLAEAYCQALDRQGGSTRYVTVRFGNVLGSTGSVVPLFQRQLARGGPLTVTHPDITRYFMSVREAVELVLQASVLGSQPAAPRGAIHVLDMGEPVKIIDLARQMIRLAGLRPDQDVAITVTGLRPGEKLYEELFHSAEPLLPSAHPAIQLAEPRTVEFAGLAAALDEIEGLARARDTDAALDLLHRLVPEFRRG
ncbi:MAG: polysaccharide biosynthesis protein [Alphaproteobacteria bacterium]|nr:MAG: polysaccharide biosynthesis protein [Alphaproteobacteria bacterium]